MSQGKPLLNSEKKYQKEDEIILQPFNHFKQLPPWKDFTTKLWRAYNYWFQVPTDKFKEVSVLSNELVEAFYLMDDFLDNSKIRRGIPATHLIYGSSRTIYSTICGTISTIGKFDEPQIIDKFIETSLKLCEGQSMEMYFTHNQICPSEEEYNKIVFNKVTPGIMFAIHLQQIFATKHKTSNFDKFITVLGQFVQICNDYLNLVSPKYANVKIFGDDITEGKFTFPIIHGIKSRPDDHRLMDILSQRTSDRNVKLHFIKLLEEYGSLEYTLRTLRRLKNECIEEMKKVASNPKMEIALDDAVNNIEDLIL